MSEIYSTMKEICLDVWDILHYGEICLDVWDI